MEDHTKETTKVTTEGPEFEMPSHYMKLLHPSRPKDKASL
jgi:hypothetical protein